MADYRTLRTRFKRLLLNKGTETWVGGVEVAGSPNPRFLHDLLTSAGIPVDKDAAGRHQGRNLVEGLALLAHCDIPAEQVQVEQSNPAIGAPADLETVIGNLASAGGGGDDAEFSRDGPYPSDSYLLTGGDSVSSDVGYPVATATFITELAIEFRLAESATIFVENESFTVVASTSVVAADEKLVTGLSIAVPAGDELRVRVRNDGAGNLSTTGVTVKFGVP